MAEGSLYIHWLVLCEGLEQVQVVVVHLIRLYGKPIFLEVLAGKCLAVLQVDLLRVGLSLLNLYLKRRDGLYIRA